MPTNFSIQFLHELFRIGHGHSNMYINHLSSLVCEPGSDVQHPIRAPSTWAADTRHCIYTWICIRVLHRHAIDILQVDVDTFIPPEISVVEQVLSDNNEATANTSSATVSANIEICSWSIDNNRWVAWANGHWSTATTHDESAKEQVS